MFIELFDKYRVNVANIASYYPYDETRIMIITFKQIDKLGHCNEIIMCGDIDVRNEILERFDVLCDTKPLFADHRKDEGITLE